MANLEIKVEDKNVDQIVVTELTAGKGVKDAKIETGYVVKVPLFINEGERIIINTKEGKYSSRA